MRDRRDYLIAAMAAALLFGLGLFLGQGGSFLPAARAQGGDTGFDPEQPLSNGGAANTGGGLSINRTNSLRPGFESRTTAATASDSDSNNRFVAVTSPVGSGESVLFLIDSKNEQLVVYRYERRKGLVFLAGRRIDYDLRITGYEDKSKFTRDEMKRLYEQHAAKAASKSVKKKGG
jgi:hypothetical protein